MRLLIISMFLAAGLVIGGVSSFANDAMKESNKGQTEEMKGSTSTMMKGTLTVNGEVTNIEGDTVTVKDEQGNMQSFKLNGTEKLQNLRTKDINVGDKVHVEMKDGQLVSFHKMEGNEESMKGENMKGNMSSANTEEGMETNKSTSATTPGTTMEEGTNGSTETMGAAGSRQYTVKRGDTLAGIARKTLGSPTRWREIAKLNDISNPNTIHVGQRLALPTTAQNTSGTTEEGTSGTMEEGTKGMSGSGTMEEGTTGETGTTNKMRGNTEEGTTTPEQVAPNPGPEEGSQPLRKPPTSGTQESGQGTGTTK